MSFHNHNHNNPPFDKGVALLTATASDPDGGTQMTYQIIDSLLSDVEPIELLESLHNVALTLLVQLGYQRNSYDVTAGCLEVLQELAARHGGE